MRHFCGGGFGRELIPFALAAILILQTAGCAFFRAEPDASSGKESSLSGPSSSRAVSSEASSQASSSLPSSSRASSASSKPASSSPPIPASPAPAKRSAKTEVQTPRKIPETQGSQKIEKKSVGQSAQASSGYQALKPQIGYQALATDGQRTLYGLIGSSVYQVAVRQTDAGYYPTGQISLPAKLTEAQIRVTLMAFQDDHPEVFWIANAYSYGYQGDRTILQLYSVLPQGDCSAAVSAFNAKVQSIVRSIPAGLDEFGREEYLFDYLTGHCAYDNAAAADQSQWQAYTAYGALVGGSAVCEGYSRAMLMLAGYAGLPSVLIRGVSDGVPHMWNGIRIGGNWYHLDVTWCDSTKLIYNYFNLDDQRIKLTHQIAPLASSLTDAQICAGGALYNLALPVCSSLEKNYFQVKGVPVSGSDASGDDAAVAALAPLMKAGKTTLPLRIVSDDYDAAVAGLVSSDSHRLALILQKTAAQAGVSLDYGDVTYTTDKEGFGMDVFIAYR